MGRKDREYNGYSNWHTWNIHQQILSMGYPEKMNVDENFIKEEIKFINDLTNEGIDASKVNFEEVIEKLKQGN